MKKKLLSILLTAVMVLSLIPAAVYADGTVAKIGDTEYDTLAAAISAAQDGDTVKLIADVEVTQVLQIDSGKSITLDLNGNTVLATAGSYGTSQRALNVTGSASLTVTDSGEGGAIIVSRATSVNTTAVYVDSGSSFELAGGTIEMANIPGPSNYWQNTNVYGVQNNGTTVISGGMIYVHTASTNYAVNCAGGTLSVTGGYIKAGNEQNTMKAPYAVYCTGGTTTVTGGTVEVDDRDTNGWSEGHLVYGTAGVTGGTYISTKALGISELAGKVQTGYVLQNNNDGSYSVVPDTSVAKIGTTKYESLADAIAAVPTDGTATTITMIGDEAIATEQTGEVITIASGKNIVLDLNGNTISGTSTQKSNYFIANYGTLEIKDDAGEGKITFCAVADSGYSVENVTVYNENGTLTLSSGAIENTTNGGLSYAVKNSSNAWGHSVVSTFNMTGGSLLGAKTDNTLRVYQNTGISWKVESKNYVNISGGYIENGIFFDTVLYTKGQNATDFDAADITRGCVIESIVNISGGTVNGLVDMKIRHPYSTALNITGGDFTNAKLQVRKYDAEYGKNLTAGTIPEPTDPMVNISGGNFTFANTGKTFLPAYDSTTSSWSTYADVYSITGGTFNVNPKTTTEYVAKGYEAVNNGDGTWTVSAVKPFAAYDANGDLVDIYLEVDDAITAAGNGGTVKLVADVNKQVSIYERTVTPLTFDLNGHWIRVEQGAGINLGATWTFLDQYTTYTFTDSVGTGGIDITPKYFGNACISDNNGRTIIIEGGTYTSTGKAIYCTASDATMTIAGGTFNGDVYVHDTGYGHGEVAITGGTFNGTISAIDEAVLEVSGGTFDHDPTSYVAEGYKAVESDGIWTVVPFVAVAQIGETKYDTVADAVAAVQDGDTIELLADVTEDLGASHTAEYLKNKTVSLTGDGTNTITAAGTSILYFGDFDSGNRAENDTLNVTGVNMVKNGGNYAVLFDGVTANLTDVNITSSRNSSLSYANGAKGTLENVTVANSGYNNGKSLTWRDAALSVQGIGTGPSELTIKSGTYTSEHGYAIYIFSSGGIVNVEGGTFSGMLKAEINRNEYNNDYNRSFIYISGGTFTNCQFIVSATGAGAAAYAGYVITGGTFDADPTAYVAEGYEAVNNGNGTWTVGKVKASEIQQAPVAAEAVQQGYEVSYTANKTVVDSQTETQVLASATAVTVNVKVDATTNTADANNASSDVAISKVDVAKVVDKVVQVAETPADTINVTIDVVRDKPVEVTYVDTTPTITFEVHPVATAFVNEVAVGSVVLTNADLAENASFTITLPVDDKIVEATTGGKIRVTHKGESGDEVFTCDVQGNEGNYYVTFTVTHFSAFELAPVSVINSGDRADCRCTLELTDGFILNFYVNDLKNEYGIAETDVSKYSVRYTYHGVTKTVALSNVTKVAYGYKIPVAYCAAKELCDQVTIDLLYNGNTFRDTITYSAKMYCDYQIDHGDETTVALCRKILQYGTFAQYRFNYNESNLADSNINPGDYPNVEIDDSDYDKSNCNSVSWGGVDGASLSLEARTEINIYFYVTTSYADASNYSATVNGQAATVINAGVDTFCVTIKGIMATDLDDVYHVAITSGNTGDEGELTIDFSALTYACWMYNDVNEHQEWGVCRALFEYYQAVQEYRATH